MGGACALLVVAKFAMLAVRMTTLFAVVAIVQAGGDNDSTNSTTQYCEHDGCICGPGFCMFCNGTQVDTEVVNISEVCDFGTGDVHPNPTPSPTYKYTDFAMSRVPVPVASLVLVAVLTTKV